MPDLIEKNTGLKSEQVTFRWFGFQNRYLNKDDIGTINGSDLLLYSFKIDNLSINKIEVNRTHLA